ncbi:DUF2141 domain-containing protein [Sphingomonas sp. BGYR3]|uniref:DUF2141 domain-containing protein n=1 Tax=Sphingomonas sp. BGYR3 TaxID=2975483 RepID=UPI0021A8E487|nr:DUF2141 domain-containing protein [Sphingomonas sp. BGYR3]MDG5488934.1 DUF2141 domain-containing protein [Sphingomonas sp. BGYR3]
MTLFAKSGRAALGLAAAAMLAMPVAAKPPLGSDSAACVNGETAIQVNVNGLKDRTGRLKLELWPANDEDFLKDDKVLRAEGKFFRRVWADMPASGPVTLCIKAPAPGRYALLFTHDRDGKNKFNFWRDGAGFVSNQKLGRSKPKLAQATVTVGNGVTTVNITAQYMRGLSGFGPVA